MQLAAIVITALPGLRLESEVRAAGAQDFVRKPYDLDALLHKVRALLTSTAHATMEKLRNLEHR